MREREKERCIYIEQLVRGGKLVKSHLFQLVLIFLIYIEISVSVKISACYSYLF